MYQISLNLKRILKTNQFLGTCDVSISAVYSNTGIVKQKIFYILHLGDLNNMQLHIDITDLILIQIPF